MLPRSIILRQRLQLTTLSQARSYSVKNAPRPSQVKTGATIGRKPSDVEASTASSKSSAPISNSINAAANSNNASRNRKLTPAAKAKAQASASRALREQIGAVGATSNPASPALTKPTQSTTSSNGPILVDEALADAVLEHPRKLHDAYAYATAESYNLEKLMASSRLPPGWQYLEDSEVIHIPSWPFHPNIASSSSSNSIPTSGEVFIFRSGSYVTWGLNSEQSRRFHRAVIQCRPTKAQSAEIESYSEIGDEAMEYLVADDQ